MSLRALIPPTRPSGLVGYPGWSGGPLLDPPEISSGAQWYLTPTNTFYRGARAGVAVGYGAVDEVRPVRCPLAGDPSYALVSGDQFEGDIAVGSDVDEISAFFRMTTFGKSSYTPALHLPAATTADVHLMYLARPIGDLTVQDAAFTVNGASTASDVFAAVTSGGVMYFARGDNSNAYISPNVPLSGVDYLFEQAITSETTGFAKINDVSIGSTKIWTGSPNFWVYFAQPNPAVVVRLRWAALLDVAAPSYASDVTAIKAWAATLGVTIGDYPS